MGLGITHGTFEAGYGAFMVFREALARAAGWRVVGQYEYEMGFDVPDELIERCAFGELTREEFPYDPLVVLICHYDSDGVITASMVGPLADRIEALLPALNDATRQFAPKWAEPTDDDRSTMKMAVQFIKGLREAHAAGEGVEFR